jgi:hypothetical protein
MARHITPRHHHLQRCKTFEQAVSNSMAPSHPWKNSTPTPEQQTQDKTDKAVAAAPSAAPAQSATAPS